MIQQLLPAGVVAVETFEDVRGEAVFPGEEDLVANAVEVRRREFVTARRCAREALAKLGYEPAPIRVGPKREPRWPVGVVGSITHTTGFRAAAVALRSVLASVGIDTEQNDRLPDGIEEAITVPGEPEMLAASARAFPDALGPTIVQREGVNLQSLVPADWQLAGLRGRPPNDRPGGHVRG
jgi:4'-phosphopantetheinyl transferase EntD